MTLNDLECPIHLKVRLVDGTLDVRSLSDSTIMHIGVARGGRRSGMGWRALPPLCGQLTRCFTAVAELLVSKLHNTSATAEKRRCINNNSKVFKVIKSMIKLTHT